MFLSSLSLAVEAAEHSIIVVKEGSPAALTGYAADDGLTEEVAPSTTKTYEKIEFSSEAEMRAYTRVLESQGTAWEPNVKYRGDLIELTEAALISGDPLIADQWSVKPTLPDSRFIGVDIDSVRANALTSDAPHVYVYVMDSGIDSDSPDLSGRVIAEYNAVTPEVPARDENGHGTHVTSIFAAKGNNGVGIRGIVPGDIKVINVKFLNQSNEGDSKTALRALQFMERDMQARLAADPKAVFIGNFSFGGDQYSKELEAGMKRLEAFRFLPVTSAGNHGRNNDDVPYFPCRFAVLANTCVAASDQYDYKTSFSGLGSRSVHLLAPGEAILGLVPRSIKSTGLDTKRGTSQAVPHVVGVAALVWAINPELQPTDVQRVLMESVDVLPGAEAEVLSAGRINAYRAVLIADGRDPSEASRNGMQGRAGGGGCSLQAESRSGRGMIFYLIAFVMGLWVLSSVFRAQLKERSTEKSPKSRARDNQKSLPLAS